MAINRYYQYNPLQKEDYAFKLPTDILGKTLMHLQDTSDKNYAELQQLPGMIHTNALTGHDTTKRNQIEQGYRNKIDQMVKGANGDYSRVNKDVIGLKAQLQKDLTTGDLAAIGSNYKIFADFQKETLAQKDLPKTYADAAIQKTLAEYNAAGGYGGIDPITGNYRQVNPIRGQGYDLSGKLGKVSQFQDITEEKAWTTKEGNWFKDYKSKTGGVAFDRVYNSLLLEAASDPLGQEHRAYLRRIGVPEEQIQKEMIGTVTAEAGRRTKDINDIDVKARWDNQADYNQRENHFNRRLKFDKDKLDAEMAGPGGIITIGDQTTGDYGKVSLSGGTYDIRTGKPTSTVLNYGNQGYMGYTNRVENNPNAVTLTGKEPLNFTHPLMKNQNDPHQKLNAQALNATAMRLKVPGYNPNDSEDKRNAALNAYAKSNGTTFRSAVEEQINNLSQASNRLEAKGSTYNNKFAENLRKQVLRQSSATIATDLNTGQKYGKLDDAIKNIGGDPADEKSFKFEVVADHYGVPTGQITVGKKTIQVELNNVNQSATGAYSGVKNFTKHEKGYDPHLGSYTTDNSGPMINSDGSVSNEAAIRTYIKGGQKVRTLNVKTASELQPGSIFGDGVIYNGIQGGRASVTYKNGKSELLDILPQDEIREKIDRANPWLGSYDNKTTTNTGRN